MQGVGPFARPGKTTSVVGFCTFNRGGSFRRQQPYPNWTRVVELKVTNTKSSCNLLLFVTLPLPHDLNVKPQYANWSVQCAKAWINKLASLMSGR